MTFGHKGQKGTTHYLPGRTVRLRNSRERQISFFSKTPADGLDQLPAAYEVREVPPSGLPAPKQPAGR